MSAFKEVGAARAQSSLDQGDERFRIGVMQAANMAGQMLVRRTQAGMRSSAVPSSPGGYSGIRTGQLVQSIDHEVEGARFLRFGSRGAFNKGFDYAIAQHEGTRKMEARPYLTNAVEQTTSDVQNVLGEVPFRLIVGSG
jgi:HK97 gp10 family phage protein